MNIEEIKSCAAEAMRLFLREHNTGCFLCIENLAVHAYPRKYAPELWLRCLIITKWEMENGLTDLQWTIVGTELLNLYNKEVACRTLLKP